MYKHYLRQQKHYLRQQKHYLRPKIAFGQSLVSPSSFENSSILVF